MAEKTLHKSQTNRVLAGVCGGLGEYFDIDPTLVRVAFILLFFSGGLGIFLYLALMVVMPDPGSTTSEPMSNLKKEAEKLQTSSIRNPSLRPGSGWLPAALIILGLVLLLDNLDLLRRFVPYYRLEQLWPLVIIFLGLWLLLRRRQ
ncbi:MAG TPA: PspC domain-containing protein [Patescibacteria group bacterium]|nr:PspC domain-containing protein [Patescibacteria group bacterium]